MQRLLAGLGILVVLASCAVAVDRSPSDDEVRQMIIRESVSTYPGPCPCPYHRARDGSRCGKRSAWSRPGGYAPLCYYSDISDETVKGYRQTYGLGNTGQ